MIALGAATQVGAQTPPKPEPGCAGVSATDGAGDQAGVTVTPGDNYDIRSLFFLTEGSRTTANITITNLSKTVPAGATDVNWYVQWTSGEDIKFIKASVSGDGTVSYNYGTLVQSIYQEEGETAGRFIEGPDGVISITVPTGITTGRQIVEPSASSYSAQNVPMVGGRLEGADSAPDSGAGKDYSMIPCATPTPTPTPGPQGRLDVTLATKSVSARKARKTVALRLSSGEAIANITGRLVKGKKIVATGRLASLNGTGTLKLKVKGKLKRGRYALRLVGTSAAGQPAKAGFSLKVKK